MDWNRPDHLTWYITFNQGVLPFNVHYTEDVKSQEIDSDESEDNIGDENLLGDEDPNK